MDWIDKSKKPLGSVFPCVLDLRACFELDRERERENGIDEVTIGLDWIGFVGIYMCVRVCERERVSQRDERFLGIKEEIQLLRNREMYDIDDRIEKTPRNHYDMVVCDLYKTLFSSNLGPVCMILPTLTRQRNLARTHRLLFKSINTMCLL